ncbi:MAG TPA: 3-phosphoshikimate 1-carboxyvinyltransferase, partial [Gammaproteobacteria bacterium]
MPKHLLSQPGGVPAGNHRVPGDKSISHRALMLSAAAGGETFIENFLHGNDCIATANALRALGTEIEISDGTDVRVRGDGKFTPPSQPLDLGNSGTGIRLLAGLLSGCDLTATMTGDASLRSRPMRRVTQPLTRMGAIIETSTEGTPPLVVHGKSVLRGIDYAMPVASAQVKSAILMAGLAAKAPVIVHEPAVTRNHTEHMLRAFGMPVSVDANTVRMEPGARLRSPGRISVPGDLSSAAFLFAAAAMLPRASITIENVGVNPTRTGILDLLARMGAIVRIERRRESSGEPVADVTVT